MNIYFDSGATTLQKPPSVARAAVRAMGELASPGRGGYPAAMEAAKAVYVCRERAARLFETEPERVVFTLNATHALNIAIKSMVAPGGRVVVSGFEHNSVMRPLYALGAQVTVAGRRLFDPEDTEAAFAAAVTEETDAVICTMVSNVFGYILPIERIAALCSRVGVPLIVDASQAAGCLPVSMKRLGARFIAMPGHKGLYGPQGTGILLCGEPGQTLLEGGTGSQSALMEMPDFLPDRLEAGTLNVAGICGLSEGLRFVMERTPEGILRHEQALTIRTAAGLRALPGITCFASPEPKTQSGVLSFFHETMDCEQLAGMLAQEGVAVRAGLHCAPEAHRSAGTLARGTVRVSFSIFNTAAQTERFAAIVRKIVNKPSILRN